MAKFSRIPLCLLVIFLTACDTKEPVKETLWYNQAAGNWFEALPLGNGRLGAMVFGTVEEERLQLNEESLWAGCPENPYPENIREHYAQFQLLNLHGKFDEALDYAMNHLVVSPTSFRSFTTLGDLFLQFNHTSPEQYKRSLDLEKGIASCEYEIEGNSFLRESFISTKYNAIFYHFTSLNDEEVDCAIRFEREKDVRVHINQDKLLSIDGQLYDDPEGYDDNSGGSGAGGYHMKFSGHVAIQSDNGEVSSIEDKLLVSKATEFTVIVSATTDYNPELLNFDRTIDSKQESLEILNKALQTPYQEIRADHIRAHSQVYNRVQLQISDLSVDTIPTDRRITNLAEKGHDRYLSQLFFQYGRYLLMSSSGGRASLPANLQGVWSDEIWARWEADYHLNINLQMNYWPADVCNLSETFDPLSDFMLRLSERGRITADKFIGSEGWMAHTVANPFGRTTPGGSTPSSQVNNGYCFPLAGAWMSMSLWRHYQFTRDKEYLRQITYPVIKGAAQFILDFLVENEQGELVTVPSYSPENTYLDPVSGKPLRNTKAATIDILIIRDIFQACLEAEQILSEDGLSNQILVAVEKLPELKIGADGTLQEWYEDYKEAEPGHRHISHLYALHPSSQITQNDQAYFEAARKTLEKRLSDGGGQTGWSRAWVINFYARLFEGDDCNTHITVLIRDQVSPNLFDLHPPHTFQIDGNLGATAGMAEMLLQSHEDHVIRLLPALPSDWANGFVKGLKARGNFEVDMAWTNGELSNANIRALSTGKTTIVYKKESVSLELKAGESYTFRPA